MSWSYYFLEASPAASGLTGSTKAAQFMPSHAKQLGARLAGKRRNKSEAKSGELMRGRAGSIWRGKFGKT